jgi:Peptidase C39 family
MIATLVVALSLAASAPAMEVPFLPQTDALCGGAAAAMMFRYWGDAHADVQEFARLVDRRAGGILNTALAEAVEKRGWRAGHIEGSLDALRASLRERQPVIVLVPERANRYHYVVVTGATGEDVVLHDPSWGPSRVMRAVDFERAWRAAAFWSLVILPPASGAIPLTSSAPAAPEVRAVPAGACDEKLAHAVAEIREHGLERADDVLGRVRADCPSAAGPLRELSGIRFAERRWSDAEALAREAVARDPHDSYALDVLASSLFMQDDAVGALRAWNKLDKPRVNLVRIEGVHHARHQTIADIIGIRSNVLLDADAFERGRRRLNDLPDQSSALLKVRPEADGFAILDVVVAERQPVPHGAAGWVGAGARVAIDREVAVAVPGVGGQGDLWSASWRWWNNRPRVAVGFAAPGRGRLPGVWRFEGSWEAETYAADPDGASLTREERTRGALTLSDWLSGNVRYSLSAGVDSWAEAGSPTRKAASIGGSLERRFSGDRLSLSADAGHWFAFDGSRSFDSAGARALARSSNETRGWVYLGTAGMVRASDDAPLTLWPGAGEGQARPPLARAHALLDDGIVRTSGSSVFGRTVVHGSVEAQRWFERPSLVRLAAAGFVDVARASRRAAPGIEAPQVDAGVGLRLKVPGAAGVLRIDAAHGLRDGADALTIGWGF